MNTDPAIRDRLDLALEIAREAGDVTLQHFRSPSLAVERKSDNSPVTVADRAAETLLRQRISDQFPDDAIVGEEFGERPGSSGYVWVLDPIDGTKSFIHGIPLYTTLIGVLHTAGGTLQEGSTQIGVIRAPALDEVIYAHRGGGTWHQQADGEPRRVEMPSGGILADALLLTSEVGSFRKRRSGQGMQVYLTLDEQVRLARTWGDAYGYLMVATGRAQVMIDPELSLWDAAALQPVIEEAGGIFCDWQGEATVHHGEAIACSSALLEEVLAITRTG